MVTTTSTPDDSNVEKTSAALELTLDDIHSYTLQLKDDDRALLKRGNFLDCNSTEGLMGSTDSFTDSNLGSEQSGLNYQALCAGLLKGESASNKVIDASLSASFDEIGSCDGTGWEDPDLQDHPSSIGRSRFLSGSISPKRRGNRRVRLVPEHSTKAVYGDHKDSDHLKLRLVGQNSTQTMLGDDKDVDYQV